MMTADDLYKKLLDAKERLQFETLRQRGIITDAVVILNPKHKGAFEAALFNAHIKKIPVIYSNYVEKDKMYFSTDVDFVETCKRSLVWKGEGEWDSEFL